MCVLQSPRLSAAVSDLGVISPVTETRLLTLLPKSDMIQTGLKPRDHGIIGEGEGRGGEEGRRETERESSLSYPNAAILNPVCWLTPVAPALQMRKQKCSSEFQVRQGRTIHFRSH